VHRVAFELASGPIPTGMLVDHICHRPLCIRPEHLQLATRKENGENRAGATRVSSSGRRGVYPRPNGAWQARVRHAGQDIHVGTFDSLEEAERAVIAKRNELFTNNLADRSAS